MKVISIDPGYDRLGVAILEEEKIIFSDTISSPNKSYENRIFFIGQNITKLIKKFKPNYLAMERIFFSQNTKTALKVAEIRGLLIYLAKKNNLEIREFNPKEVKIAVTNYGNSSKENISLMINKLFKLTPKKRMDDEIDAIAIGITFFSTYKYYNENNN